MESITTHGELVTTFHTFSEWVNKASSRIGGFARRDKLICLDKNGYSCTIGEDFMYARDNDLFPIKSYRLTRSVEQK